ncbi:MAG: GH92 family glycosyl hydrolase [Bacteroidetes bacterium]|nr:GH92 family glycosyl hydrolase [Bacteroidota bacterium]
MITKRNRTITYCIFHITFFFLSTSGFAQQKDFTTYVDPFIGTGGHGHTFPGATTPFGMVQLSPDTRDDGSWDGCGGYHYSDSMMFGFSHTHLSGTGCSDYGDILMMPVIDSVSMQKKFSAKFNHENEKAEAGFYSVKLDNGISAELTATTRCGMHKYSFPNGADPAVLLDLIHRDKVLDGYLKIVDKKTIEGFRRSQAWAKDQVVYFRIEFAKPFIDSKMLSDSMKKDVIRFRNEYFGKIKALFRFDLQPGEMLLAKVSISGVDIEGARKNMLAEMPDWNFEKVKANAKATWNAELSKIDVTGGTNDSPTAQAMAKDNLKIFYTALYHCFIQPNIYNDVDGRYRGRDFKIHTAEGFNYYTVFSLWDTFRAYHPLMTIIDRKRTLDFIKTFLAQYDQGGLLPVWELSSNETECMIGYHSVSVIADAAMKGITDFDMEKALEAMKKSAESRNRYGLGAYMDKGMIETDDDGENVSRTLEYAYDDWCIAQMAKLLHKEKDYQTYLERSQNWKNLFDPVTGFIRPRKNGGWYEPFDAREVNNNYTEANAWQYTFFVPQETEELVHRLGGIDKFESKLDELFTAESKTTGRDQSDITGMIGQYAHGNEPSHHMAYLYNHTWNSWKTQQRVKQILSGFYHAAPDGLIGNEDCGQMSAWYVMSAMGIYQPCPGDTDYALGVPLFADIKINLENGKQFLIKRKGSIGENMYAKSFVINGKPRGLAYVFHGEIANGKELDFVMKKNMPDDASSVKASTYNGYKLDTQIVAVPVIHSTGQSFRDKTEIDFLSLSPKDKIYYSLDGSSPNFESSVFIPGSMITIDATTTVKAMAINDRNQQSKIATAQIKKMQHPDWKIKLNSTYDHQYTAGGDEALIDGIRGDVNWRKGYWQGYQGQDFECIIDLGSEQRVGSFSAGFLQDIGAWVMLPKKVEFSFSKDGVVFSDNTNLGNNISDRDEKVQIKNFKTMLLRPVDARYVKVRAINYGKLPEWHLGAGGDSWIFVDEISIN